MFRNALCLFLHEQLLKINFTRKQRTQGRSEWLEVLNKMQWNSSSWRENPEFSNFSWLKPHPDCRSLRTGTALVSTYPFYSVIYYFFSEWFLCSFLYHPFCSLSVSVISFIGKNAWLARLNRGRHIQTTVVLI